MTPHSVAAGDAPGRTVGGERLRGRAEVELHSAWNPNPVRRVIDLDRVPARGAFDPYAQRRAVGGDAGEVAVVAEDSQRAPDRGIDHSVGRAGGGEADVERGDEERGDGHPRARGRVDLRELRVVAEPAARPVDRVDLQGEHQARLVAGIGVGDGDDGGRAEGAEPDGRGELSGQRCAHGDHARPRA